MMVDVSCYLFIFDHLLNFNWREECFTPRANWCEPASKHTLAAQSEGRYPKQASRAQCLNPNLLPLLKIEKKSKETEHMDNGSSNNYSFLQMRSFT